MKGCDENSDNYNKNMCNVYINTQSSLNNDISNYKISNYNLFSLNSISVCQGCNIQFDSNQHLPLSYQCGHFFCKKCIIMKYTDSENIVFCPVDGCTEKTVKELKILHNLILDHELNEKKNKNYDITQIKNNFIDSKLINITSKSPEKPIKNDKV